MTRDPLPDRLATERLDLVPLDLTALEAWVTRNAAALREATGATFPEPAAGPPLVDEDLPKLRDALRADPAHAEWPLWLMVLREEERPVGALGAGPAEEGVVVIGYSVYPTDEGRGYATEATGAILRWALGRHGVERVRATIPGGSERSIRVAEKLGLRHVGEAVDPEAGPVRVYEIERTAR